MGPSRAAFEEDTTFEKHGEREAEEGGHVVSEQLNPNNWYAQDAQTALESTKT